MLFSNLSDYRVMLEFDHQHRELFIFNKITPSGIIGFKCYAPIATEFVFFLHCKLDIKVFRGTKPYLLRRDEKTAFSNTSGKVEKANNYKRMIGTKSLQRVF